MSETDSPENEATPPMPQAGATPPVRMVLLAQAGLFILCSGIGVMLYQIICAFAGWEALQSIGSGAGTGERWQFRFYMGLGHFFMFLVSGGLTVWFFYKGNIAGNPSWPDYLKCRRLPGIVQAGLSLLLMLAATPLVVYALKINQQIPLPEYLSLAEDQMAEVLKGLLRMEHSGELLANLFVIALLPALGEELVFRGVVQQQLMRKIRQPITAIFLSALVFSAAHFQFEGFLPRLLLGLILGWLYWKTQNFWIPVLCHFFNNGTQVLGQYLFQKEISSLDLEQDIEAPWPFALLSLFMSWAVVRLIQQNTASTGKSS